VQTGEQVLPLRGMNLAAVITVPHNATGVVVFAHGSGSGLHSPRNQYVASVLNDAGLATVLADLLTPDEERRDQRTAEVRFDVGLLAERVCRVVDWVDMYGVGLFGASTGAAAALRAAAERPEIINAVVSRGGRPDLAADALERVQAPTLLVVGGRDETVLELNREAYERLPCEKRLDVVPGATHLFEERGALEQVATLAADWFASWLLSR
jgi:putative phosphoribosyl transferase